MSVSLRPRAMGQGQAGLTLVELLIALLIGLFLTVGILQIFLETSRSYRAVAAMSRLQENGRFALEIMARDLRMAGFSGCAPELPVANVLNGAGDWWKDFGTRPVRGYAGNESFPGKAFCSDLSSCTLEQRIPGTDAIVVLRGGDVLYRLAEGHVPESAQFKLQTLHHLKDGSIVMVCDHRQAAILQLTNVNTSNRTLVHNTGRGSPGNCTKGLGLPVDCSDTTGTLYAYGVDSILVDFQPVAYYIGASALNPLRRALYRVQLTVDEGSVTASMAPRALIDDVVDMQIAYGEDTNSNNQADRYTASPTDWANVVSVRVELLMRGPDDNVVESAVSLPYNGATYTAPDRGLYRSFEATVGLRNRLP